MDGAVISNPASISSAKAISRSDRRLIGKQIRERVPRSAHTIWNPSSNRPSVEEFLCESNRDRLSNLIPIRHGRMLRSPLAYFRGLALAMAYDLRQSPNTGIQLPICGDCHLQNLGWFATPERHLVFDITDFDETSTGCWEWDIKRLATSFVLAARELSLGRSHQQEILLQVVKEYRNRLSHYDEYAPLQMWYEKIDARAILAQATLPAARERIERMIELAKSRTIESLLPKITNQSDTPACKLQIIDQPPLLFHDETETNFLSEIESMLQSYRETLSDDRAVLFRRYFLSDMAMKVVGVGSVGLRCGILVFQDADNTSLVLQIKEARPSVFESFQEGISTPVQTYHQGFRVVHGQRMIQGASDILLGWTSDTRGRHYYLRQLRDMKLSIDVEHLNVESLLDYAQMCGWALARAHSKSDQSSYIAGYLGAGEQFDLALAAFAFAYADQVELDFREFQKLATHGNISFERL